MSAGAASGVVGGAEDRPGYQKKFNQVLADLKKLDSHRFDDVLTNAKKIEVLKWIEKYFTEFKAAVMTLPPDQQENKFNIAIKCMHSKFPPFEIPDPKPMGIKEAWRKLWLVTHPDRNRDSKVLERFASATAQLYGNELNLTEKRSKDALKEAKVKKAEAPTYRKRLEARVARLRGRITLGAGEPDPVPSVPGPTAFEAGEAMRARNESWKKKLHKEREEKIKKDSDKPSEIILSWMNALKKADQTFKDSYKDSYSFISPDSKDETVFGVFKKKLEVVFFAYYGCVFKKGSPYHLINQWSRIPGLGVLLEQVILRDPEDKKDPDPETLQLICTVSLKFINDFFYPASNGVQLITHKEKIDVVSPKIGVLVAALQTLAISLLGGESSGDWRKILGPKEGDPAWSIEELERLFVEVAHTPPPSSSESDVESESESESESDSESKIRPRSVYETAFGFVFAPFPSLSTSSPSSKKPTAGNVCGAGSRARPDIAVPGPAPADFVSFIDLTVSAFRGFKKELDQLFQTFKESPVFTKEEKGKFKSLKGSGYLLEKVVFWDESKLPEPSLLDQAKIGYAFFIFMRSDFFTSGFNGKILEEEHVPLINAWRRLNSEVCHLGLVHDFSPCRQTIVEFKRWAEVNKKRGLGLGFEAERTPV